MPVNQSTMSRLLGRMTAAMGKPFSDAKVERQAEEYARAMGQLPEYAVEWAVDRLIRETDKYPKAATIRKMAHDCPQLLNGNHDQSVRSQMRRWEADPWKEIESLADDTMGCRSSPCPVCGSVIVFSHRGMVVVHDDRRHSEAQASYSNLGRPEWLDMPVLTFAEPKKRLASRTPNPYPIAREPSQLAELFRQTADDSWESAQQARAEAEDAA